MAIAALSYGIVRCCLNNITSSSMGIPSRMTIENRIPELRNQTGRLAGRHGLFDFGQTLSARIIEITCLIPPGKNDAALLSLKDSIVNWLNPDKGLCPLILDREPGRRYMARLQDGLSFETLVRNSGTFDLTFFCPDPFAYAVADETFTLTDSADITRTLGNVESHPLYLLRGSIPDEGSYIRFSVNGETVQVNGPLLATDALYIDTEDMTAKKVSALNEETNALGLMDTLVFPYLNTGSNTVTIGTSGSVLASLAIHARSRWL